MSAIPVLVVELNVCFHNNKCFVVDKGTLIKEKMKSQQVQRRTIIKAKRRLLIEIQKVSLVPFALLLCISCPFNSAWTTIRECDVLSTSD